jgi:predicted transcriptional regulator of viral defense system
MTGATEDEYQFRSGCRTSDAKLRVAAVASRQFGRVRRDQLRALGIGQATIRRWIVAGYLHRELPRVYAVGHPGRSIESDLAAALLYAGPGAMLSHATGLWWLGLLKYPPRQIHVSSPRRILDRSDIVVHAGRHIPRIWHRGLPVTTPSQALLDFAAHGPHDLLRLALANADYHGLLDLDALQRLMGQGTHGTAALKHALNFHLPQLARTRSGLETLLLELCETHHLPIPEVNIYVEGWLVDATWPQRSLVVEVDGWRAHRTHGQLETDHQRDLELRHARYAVLRYTERQLTETPAAVAAELSRFLS